MSIRRTPIKALVVGSLNMDLVVKTERMALAGENLLGEDFRMIPGGKGANQAVALARLGAETAMAGRVGKDVFGNTLITNLTKEGVNTDRVSKDEEEATGVAFIMVDRDGQNSILIVLGANGRCSLGDVDSLEEVIKDSDVVLLQLEIPMPTVERVISIANRYEVKTVLDAGPAQECPTEVLVGVDILSPNEHEAGVILGTEVSDVDSATAAARQFLSLGVKNVVLKLGERGALVASDDTLEHLAPAQVESVDSTAAGDAFTAALALAYAGGSNLVEASRYANSAGALAVTVFGAQPSMPTEKELERFIRSKGVVNG